MEQRLAALRVALGNVRGPRDQRKMLLMIDGRAKVNANRQIEFDHKAGVNFDL